MSHDLTAWIDFTVLLIAALATIWAQSRQLPAQNVAACVLLIIILSTVVEIAGARWGVPFGRFVWMENLGPDWRPFPPWQVPLIWIIAMLTSRGVARLILRPWRKLTNYGLWVIALTCVLTTLFVFVLEPFVSELRRYWIWQRTPNLPMWYHTPLINFFGWFATTLLILIIITPWLINKRASAKSVPDYFPLVIWAGLLLALAAVFLMHQFWPAAAIALIIPLAVGSMAWKNSRW